jgi:Mg-chelatase subunit ChlD
MTTGFFDRKWLLDRLAIDSERLRVANVRLIVLQASWEHSLLPAMLASEPEDFYVVPDGATLQAIGSQLGQELGAHHLLRHMDLTVRIPSEFEYVESSSIPPGIWDASVHSLSWAASSVSFSGWRAQFQSIPKQEGRHKTIQGAVAEVIDGFGNQFSLPLLPPSVVVVAPPTPTASPSRTPTAVPIVSTPTRETRPAIYLPMTLNESCIKELRRVDVVMILDASTSMLDPTSAGRSKLDAAREAALALVDELDFAAGDQGGLVVFNERATVLVDLIGSRVELAEALDGVKASPGTCVPCGTQAAVELLFGPRRNHSSTPALVLLTDGFSNIQPIGDALPIAEQAKARGAEIFTIGLGAAVEEDTLRQIASGEDKYFAAIDAEALTEIFSAIVTEIPCPASRYWGRR